MRISDAEGIKRYGSLIDMGANSEPVLHELAFRANFVEKTENYWLAPSATAAIAWLLELAHLNALGEPIPGSKRSTLDIPFRSNQIVGFRGQRGEYATLLPSLESHTRIEAREYTLRGTGRVRVVSGIQSLLSVYLVALAILTYFGTPFEY
jgi:hypothetical protein